MLVALVMVSTAAQSWAGSKINIGLMTILASNQKGSVDPRLKNVVGELQSVFKYSSYELIGTEQMQLGLKQTGTAPLPGKRVLKVTPHRITGDRVEMRLVIIRKKKKLFQTVVSLLNGGSIFVGGPKHKGGYLLFKISGSY